MACHTANLAFMGLELGYPTRVSARSGAINSETYPPWATITYEFPARGSLPPVKFTWYEGARDGQRNLPRRELLQGETPSSSGALLVGAKGSLFTSNDYGIEQKLLPTNEFVGYEPPAPTIERLGGNDNRDSNQKREWIHAIVNDSQAKSNFDYAAVLTETMLLGNVAVRVGEAIDYNADKREVTNCREAAQFIDPEFRHGWTL